jgi:hypothetical protein
MRATQASIDLPPPASQARVSKSAARELIVTTVLALTDEQPGSLDIEIVGALGAERVDLRLRAVASKRSPPLPSSVVYHTLVWEDVANLAAAHDVLCTRANGTSTLGFAVLPAR